MTLDEIKTVVDVVTGYNTGMRSRKTGYAYSRKIYYALCMEFAIETRCGVQYNYSQIGKSVGTDHATVINQIKSFERDILGNAEWRRKYEQARYYTATKTQPSLISPEADLNKIKDENFRLTNKMSTMEMVSGDTKKLLAIYNSLPDRLREDVMFKVEVAHKLNEKHKRDLNVIYTEG